MWRRNGAEVGGREYLRKGRGSVDEGRASVRQSGVIIMSEEEEERAANGATKTVNKAARIIEP
jgi:hypothetical protein